MYLNQRFLQGFIRDNIRAANLGTAITNKITEML